MAEAPSGQVPGAMTPRQMVGLGLRFLVWMVILAGLLFAPAGRLDIPAFWVMWVLWAVYSAISVLTLVRTDPSLIKERTRPGPGGKDPYTRFLAAIFFLVHWIVASLDVGRYHWSDTVPLTWQVAAFVGLAAALALTNWAVSVNRFYSSDARIQRDRGHYVITDGPYRFLRHPGYLSGIVMCICSPLALGSYYSGIPTLALLPFFVRRLRIEERLLLAELEGYPEYAQRVRYRLLPGVW